MIRQFLSAHSASKKIRLFFPLFLILIFQIPVRGQPNTFTLNFEEGSLRGWQVIGEAFRNQPTLGDNSRARNRGQSNLEGNWWIGTFENYQGKPGQQKGAYQGDELTGRLYSPTFEIPKGMLSFLIGGGSSPDTRVELCVGTGPGEFQSKVVYTASGKNRETMERVTWDLSNYAGQIGFISIVDYSTGPWGHINVDDFKFISERVIPPDFKNKFERVQVPSLYGLRINEANDQLRVNSLSLGSVTEEESDRAKGTIINQNPAPGSSAFLNSKVNIVVAKPRMLSVPYLIGSTYERAKALLDRKNLIIQNSGTRESEMEPGRIVAQVPDPNTSVEAKSIVKVFTAIPILVFVPDLTGLSKQAAEERIKSSRLTTGEIKNEESEKEKDKVFNQDPKPGTRAKIGEIVKFWISSGPKKTEVPDLIGLSRGEAVRIILQNNLAVGQISQVNENKASGIVLYQNPTAGAMVEPGSKIILKVQKQVYALALSTNITEIDSGQAIQFTASITPSNDKVQFEFNYGDGQRSNWTSKPVLEYIYPKSGRYLAYVRSKIGNDITQSEPVIISVNSVKGWPKDFFIIIAFGGVAAVSYVIRKLLNKIPARSIDIRTNKGQGIQTIKNIKGLNINMNIRLRPSADPGKYRIIMN